MPIHIGDKVFESDARESAFDKAVKHLVNKGYSEKSARAIVGKIEQNIKKTAAMSSVPEFYEEDGKKFGRFFLINSDWNGMNWKVDRASIPEHIATFEGMPMIDEPKKEHFGMTEFTPVSQILETQDNYKIGMMIKTAYNAQKDLGQVLVEFDDTPKGNKAFLEMQNGEDFYVSPAVTGIARQDPMGGTIYDVWHGLHLARVKNPAYGVMAASMKETCVGPRSTCINRLMQNAVASGKVPSSSFNIVNSKANYMPECPDGEEMYNGKCIKKEVASIMKEKDDLVTKVASLEKDKTALEEKIKTANASQGSVDASKKLIDDLSTKLSSFENKQKEGIATDIADLRVQANLVKQEDHKSTVEGLLKSDMPTLQNMYASEIPLLEKIISLSGSQPGNRMEGNRLVHIPNSTGKETTGSAAITNDKKITSLEDVEDLF